MDFLVHQGWEERIKQVRDPKDLIHYVLLDKYHQKMMSICSPVTSLLDGVRCPAVIQLKEDLEFVLSKECISKFYPSKSHAKKLQELTTYYKYHQEVPRLFMKEKSQIIHEYYDTKRRLIYEQVKRMLASQHLKGRPS